MCLAALLTGTCPSESAESAPPVRFARHVLNADSQFSACAVLDVNQDGRPDIFCGGYWYEGPRWNAHPTRDVPMIRGRYDDYSNLPMDVDGDGWIDIISVNYRSRSLFWVQHPGAALSSWRTHLIDTPGQSETGRLGDVDGDGKLDVLPNGTSYAAWYELVRRPGRDGQLEPVWLRHNLPEQVSAHGVGLGDVDGDNRADVVTTSGWAKGPADPRRDRWPWNAEFQLHRDSSIPILVHDVDGDADQDLIWGRGHNIGIYWLEQQSQGGQRTWLQHAIDTSWSSAHSILLADLDGDGKQELVAGKRYLGHDGKDPGETDPLVVVAYRFLPATRSWQAMPISWGGNCGFDLDPACADVDLDGDLDLVAPTRAGLCLLENLRVCTDAPRETTNQEPTPVHYTAATPLLVMRQASGPERPITSPLEWGYRRQQILQNMAQVMGPMPAADRRVPLDVAIESRQEAEGYERVRLSFAAETGDRIPALLLIPNNLAEPTAAMLCLHPTHKLGKDQICGLGGDPDRAYAHELAQRGFICLAPDYPSFGEYPFDFSAWTNRYSSGTMKAIWNNVRALDVLEAWPSVDRDRIGCIGHSLGGHNALFTAASDQRIRAVVTSCGFTAFADYYQGDLTGWASDRYMPRIRDVYELSPRHMPFDFHEVIAAIAPRPVFINAPLEDDNFSVAGVRTTVQRVRPVYDLFAVPDRLRVQYPQGGHDFPSDVRNQVYQWLKEVL
jgi:acetyl esterase/lipase